MAFADLDGDLCSSSWLQADPGNHGLQGVTSDIDCQTASASKSLDGLAGTGQGQADDHGVTSSWAVCHQVKVSMDMKA